MAELEHFTKTGIDTSQFHNYAIEWTSAGIRGFIDGVEWFNVADGAIANVRSNIQNMPEGQLVIGLDNYTGASGLRDAAMEIEWARAYSLTPSQPDPGGGGTVPEKTQAATLILDRLNSGQPIFEDWTWTGAPPIVDVHNDALLAEFRQSHPLPTSSVGATAKTWLANYINSHGGNVPVPDPGGGGSTGTRTAGPGGVPKPAGAVTGLGSSGSQLNISTGGTSSNPRVIDGESRTVGRINITAEWVVVQNYKVVANSQYGILIDDVSNVTVQNCDIKGVEPTGDGDMNAITAFGNNIKILYNTMIDFVEGDPGDSHTDGIQTWISSSHPISSSNWEIVGNIMKGPHNPSRSNSVPSIHQCIMQEGPGRGGNSGGSSTTPSNWLIADNTFLDSWNQCIKLDGISNAKITRNKFEGSSDKVVDNHGGVTFYSDNQITGDYGSVGITITQGSGPPATSV